MAVDAFLFFDTNICHHAANRTIPLDVWQHAVAKIPQTFKYCISPLTVLETVHSLTTCDPIFFVENRVRLRLLTSIEKRIWLDDPILFQQKALAGLPTKSNWKMELNLSTLFAMIAWVEQKSDLENPVSLPYMNSAVGYQVFLQHGKDAFDTVKGMYAQRMESARSRPTEQRRRKLFVEDALRITGVPDLPKTRAAIASGMDAAFVFESRLISMVKSDYNFAAHADDLIDAQQLYYLLDPQMYFVTNDNRLIDYVRKSSQANRILTFDQLVVML